MGAPPPAGLVRDRSARYPDLRGLPGGGRRCGARAEAYAEIDRSGDGRALAAIDSGYMKSALVRSRASGSRINEARSGVGRTAERRLPSPLLPATTAASSRSTRVRSRDARDAACDEASAARPGRPHAGSATPRGRPNLMPLSIACAKAGVTTGEWATRSARCSAPPGDGCGGPAAATRGRQVDAVPPAPTRGPRRGVRPAWWSASRASTATQRLEMIAVAAKHAASTSSTAASASPCRRSCSPRSRGP